MCFFVQNKVKEIHFQLANYLAKNVRQILIPALPVAEFVKRENRKLGEKTVKNMLGWSHYAFRQRLKNTVRRGPPIICFSLTHKSSEYVQVNTSLN